MKGARVLVADDEMLSRDVLVRMLGSRGFHVDAVNDGPACMAWLERDTPDLVLLDVAMPDMSGMMERTVRNVIVGPGFGWARSRFLR